jgi:DNA-binding CsgD family transcriptional regulator
MASGRSVSDIAGELDLSVKAANTDRARIIEKLGLRHNAQIMRHALEHNLID